MKYNSVFDVNKYFIGIYGMREMKEKILNCCIKKDNFNSENSQIELDFIIEWKFEFSWSKFCEFSNSPKVDILVVQTIPSKVNSSFFFLIEIGSTCIYTTLRNHSILILFQSFYKMNYSYKPFARLPSLTMLSTHSLYTEINCSTRVRDIVFNCF